jgi:carotenoid cleavage dioxygenase
MTDTATNRWVQGPFAPVEVETTAFDLPVTGTLPPELDGRYLRNGPNPIGPVDPVKHHWFVGDGMVHGVRLRDGRAEWYRNRWVRGAAVSEALGEAPVPGAGVFGDVANTNVIGHAGRTFAIVEAGGPIAELDEELATICFTDLGGTLPNGFTAHPKRDPRTGKLHAANYFWARPEVIEYVVVGTDGRVEHAVDVPVPGNPMVHDCSITETSMVLYDLPCTFDLDRAMGGDNLPYSWDPDYGARIGILPLEGRADQVQWFDIENCYVFHPVNARDDGDRVVVDVARHPRMFDREKTGPDEGAPSIWRWTFDRTSGKATEEQVDDRPLEFPRVDERAVGRRHRFSWGVQLGLSDDVLVWPSADLVRYDADRKVSETITFGPDRIAGEAVFVPRTEEAAEDDGWYLAFVNDLRSGTCDLVVLDASAPTEGPVASVHLPVRVPLGFHGNWVPTGS